VGILYGKPGGDRFLLSPRAYGHTDNQYGWDAFVTGYHWALDSEPQPAGHAGEGKSRRICLPLVNGGIGFR